MKFYYINHISMSQWDFYYIYHILYHCEIFIILIIFYIIVKFLLYLSYFCHTEIFILFIIFLYHCEILVKCFNWENKAISSPICNWMIIFWESAFMLKIFFYHCKYWLVWFLCFMVYKLHTISFQTFFIWALLLIVHTWNSSRLRSNLLQLQCTCCTVPTTYGRSHGSPLVWACQWPSSQPLSSPQLSHNDSLSA